MKKLLLTKRTPAVPTRRYRISYNEELNEAQLQAVMHDQGPALVLAGAGTGKTRTLTYRVARLVEDGVDPSQILLLTFTRKAATEMITRAGALLHRGCDTVAGGTFHSFGYKILQRFGKGLGLTTQRSISVLDQSDAQDAMSLVRSRVHHIQNVKRFPKGPTLAAMAGKAVNTMRPLDDVITQDFPGYAEIREPIADVIRAYQSYKQAHNLVDYDDLLLLLLSATQNQEVAPILQRQYKYIMVDEYQDTNALQHAIIMGLAGEKGNVMVVGDDAQSIYAFRGADIHNIHAYPKCFPSCTVIRLEQNYRSTQPILEVCNAVISNAQDLFPKKLYSSKTDGELPMIVACSNERQQSEFIVQQVLDYVEQGISLTDIAVLFRSSFLSFDLEIELAKANIPFRKVGGLKFLEAAHIKDMLALARITENPRDALAWYRALLLIPKIGSRSAETFLNALLEHPDPLQPGSIPTHGRISPAITTLIEVLQMAVGIDQPEQRMNALAQWYKPLLERKYDDANKRWVDVGTICAIGAQYTTMTRFLADVAIEPPHQHMDVSHAEADEDDVLTLSTIHSAKGLEWHSVIVQSLNDGHLPSSRSFSKTAELEEERRLLHVACTRAKECLVLTYNIVAHEGESSDVLGRQSRFLETLGHDICHQYVLSNEDELDATNALPTSTTENE